VKSEILTVATGFDLPYCVIWGPHFCDRFGFTLLWDLRC